MRRFAVLLLILSSTLPMVPPPAFATAMFMGLGDLAGGAFTSSANGVSADGSTVVGASEGADGNEAFRWTRDGGMVGLGFLADGTRSEASRVSADGSVIVGESENEAGTEAFRWTSAGGMVGLGFLEEQLIRFSEAADVSADGSIVVGNGFGFYDDAGDIGISVQAFRWTAGSGMVYVDDLAPYRTSGNGVSADGATLVGSIYYGYTEAFRWTSAGGMELGHLSSGGEDSVAYGVSADGATVVGTSTSDDALYEAFRWTSEDGMIGLGGFSSAAYDVSADGSTVVGRTYGASGNEAFLWTQAGGMRSLRELLETSHGLDLSGWTLTEARGISDDGLTIVGAGTNPLGHSEAWIVTIPEPGTALLMLVGLLAIAGVRR